MTRQEYEQKKKILKQDYDHNLYILDREYAMANNPYKIGDIIEDHIGRIKIEKISFGYSFPHETPECIYYGIEVKKDNTPKKKQDLNRKIFQSNIK